METTMDLNIEMNTENILEEAKEVIRKSNLENMKHGIVMAIEAIQKREAEIEWFKGAIEAMTKDKTNTEISKIYQDIQKREAEIEWFKGAIEAMTKAKTNTEISKIYQDIQKGRR
jgi:hypothetical protein